MRRRRHSRLDWGNSRIACRRRDTLGSRRCRGRGGFVPSWTAGPQLNYDALLGNRSRLLLYKVAYKYRRCV